MYYDYLYCVPIANLPLALSALSALVAAGIARGLPQNMLGDPRDSTGNIINDDSTPAFYGRLADSGVIYVAIRSETDLTDFAFDPGAYGLLATDPDISAAVLGVWA